MFVWSRNVLTKPVDPKPATAPNASTTSKLYLRKPSLRESFYKLIANVCIVIGYSLIFGWGWTEVLVGTFEEPDHWQWFGGLVGVVGNLIRGGVLMVLFIPYTFFSLSGLFNAVRAFRQNHYPVVAALLMVIHTVMLIPPACIVMGFKQG